MKTNSHLIVLILLAVLAGCAPQEGPKASVSQKYVQQCIRQIEQGQIDRSLESFKKAVALDPEDPDTYITIGQLYYDTQNYFEAADVFSGAIIHYSDAGEFYYMLALCQHRLGERTKALPTVNKAVYVFDNMNDDQQLRKAIDLRKAIEEGIEFK